ncbi:MAG TPA: hypothetical protein VNW99_14150 [Cytophagaceae bacterium]|jgi:hypothetical protein|nr:hypothetical protein [Cytophagaceae bacterium]
MADAKRPTYKSEKMSSRADPIKNAISLIGEKRKLSEGRKSSSDIFGKIAGQSNASLGGSTQGWRSVASGFTQGLQNAAELGSIFENEKLYKEHKNVIDSITAINDQTLVDSEKHRRDEKGREAVIPDYWGFESAIERGADEQSRLEMVNRMRLKYQEITGEKMPAFVSGLTNSPRDFVDEEGNIKNLPALIFGKEYSNNRLSAIDPDYQMQLQEKRQQYQEKQALEERKVRSLEGVNDARRRKYESEISASMGGGEEGNNLRTNEKLQSLVKGPSATARQRSLSDSLAMGKETLSMETTLFPEFLGLIETTPDIDSYLNRASADKGFLDIKSEETRNAIAQYDKQTSNIAQGFARALGTQVTDERVRLLLKGMPNWDQPYESRLRNFKTKLQQVQTLKAYGLYAEEADSRGAFPSSQGFSEFLDDHPNLVPLGINKEAFDVTKMNSQEFSSKRESLEEIKDQLHIGNNNKYNRPPVDLTVTPTPEIQNKLSNIVLIDDPETGEVLEFDINDPRIDAAIQMGGVPRQ